MTWIETIEYAQSTGRLRRIYDRVKGPEGAIDNILRAHSLRPHTLEGHMALYKSVLHHSGNTLPKWLAEAIGVQVSLINGCDYCVQHHFTGLGRILADDERARQMLEALKNERHDGVFEPAEAATLKYAAALTRAPASLDVLQIDELRSHGFGDAEILEINQVAAYFAYANRTVLGLGVTADGEPLGLAPVSRDDESDWSHGAG